MNKILFVEGLSLVTKTAILEDVFQKFQGYKEVRHIHEKKVAFVEFDNEDFSTMAMSNVNGYQISEANGEVSTLRISYAKKWAN